MATTWKRGLLLPPVALAPAATPSRPSYSSGREVTSLARSSPTMPGKAASFALQRLEVELAVRRMRDHRVRHALLADQRGQRAGIDAGDGDDAARFEPGVEVLRRAIIRRRGDRRAQHAAAHPAGGEAARLHVLVIGADIADMREGEGDDLPGIGRIGQDLLIAGHGGVEADLADGDAGCARALAFDDGAVGKHERRGRPLLASNRRRARARRLRPLRPEFHACRSSSLSRPVGGRRPVASRVQGRDDVKGCKRARIARKDGGLLGHEAAAGQSTGQNIFL